MEGFEGSGGGSDAEFWFVVGCLDDDMVVEEMLEEADGEDDRAVSLLADHGNGKSRSCV